MATVPDFFQDECEAALRCQVEWQQEHLGLEDVFFTKLLRESQHRFSSWVRNDDILTTEKQDVLRDWWRTVLHLLSFHNFDEQKVRTFLERPASTSLQAEQSVFSTPWSGSLKEYLESHGKDAISEVHRWVESFRFGDSYALPAKGHICLSTQP